MEITKEFYDEKSRENELYNSYWKTCKSKIEEYVINADLHEECSIGEIKLRIELTLADDDNTSMILRVLNRIQSAIKSVYNCDYIYYKLAVSKAVIDASWNKSSIIPYRKEN